MDLSGVVVKLNPDAAWAKRTQSIEVLGREQASDGFTSLKARADHTFDPVRATTPSPSRSPAATPTCS